MLPDVEFLQKLTNEKKMQDIAEKKKLTDEFINLPEVRETLLDRAENGCDSASLRVPSVYMKAISEIKEIFKQQGFEILPSSYANQIRVTWEKGDLA